MYLGIDLGTSSVKVVLIGEDQKVLASASAAMSVTRPHPGWSEQDPAEWLRGTGAALERLAAEHPGEMAAVRGIGTSGHMHGATLLGRDDRVLRPCMLWNDTRSFAEAAAMDEDPDFRAISGNIVFPGFTAPKVEWVRRHEAAIFDQTAKILLPKDYLNLWLTGDHISEMSDAAGTAWFDTGARDWSDKLLEACALTRDHMPRLVEGAAPAGRLRPGLAARFGIGEAVVAGGAGDNAAAATGLGVVRPDEAFVSLGTSGVLFVSNARFSPNPASAVHAFCHAIPGTWHQMGVILSATDSLNWLAGVTGRTPAELTRGLDRALAPGAVTFLPYLAGERTPHNDARVRGAFTGLGHATSTEDLTRAVMDGVAFALRDCLEALKAAGTRPERLLATGGGARSRAWLQAIATLLDLPVDLPAEGDFGAALGAARLGLMAAGGGDAAGVCTRPAIAASIEPDPDLKAAYDAGWARFRNLYPALKEA